MICETKLKSDEDFPLALKILMKYAIDAERQARKGEMGRGTTQAKSQKKYEPLYKELPKGMYFSMRNTIYANKSINVVVKLK